MKKNTIITALVLLVAVPMFAERVTPEAARIAATTFMNNNGTKAVELTDISKEAGFPNLYIFTAEKGFVVMAADDCVQPVLGYSLTGTFVTENMPDNVKGWLQGYSDEIQYSIDNQLKASSETAQQWKDLCSGNPNMPKATTVVTPLLQTQWNQGNPYNLLCPSNSVTGCVATAMAQVMKYWNYPAHGIGWHSYIPGTHPEYGELYAEYNSTNYDWNNMTNTYGSSSTDAQKQAVATLMYHCGVSVDMDYSPSSSGAVTSYVADALKLYFNYSSEAQHLSRSAYSESDWINMLKADLNQNRPIQYHGNGSGGGHSFVCDGYDSDNYFHFNWGWGGYCDAYYSINNLNPGPGGIGSGSNGIYNNNQGAIFGVHPSDCTASAPNNLTCTQNGRNLTLQWTAASGAASYNIYCNMSLVGNVTTNSFAYTAPFGSSRYYVRSVDANGELSLSTNMVTVTVDYQMPVVDDLAASVSGSNVSLSWTAPEWCYPETPSATLTYGNGNYTGSSLGYHDGTTTMYWGHKYPASSLSTYSNMVVYKVSFYAKYTGSYKVYVYQGTTSDHPQTEVLQQSFMVGTMGWFDVDLSNTIQIDATQDLWVFIYDTEAHDYPATYCDYSGANGCYISTNPTSWAYAYSGLAFLVNTYLTDGTYTYNIYRNGSSIANNVNNTSYNDNNLANGSYSYYVKTNYYGGETTASNSVSVEVGGLTQTTEFTLGWNWWSTYIDAEDILSQLTSGLGENGQTIKSKNQSKIYRNGSWIGALNTITNETSYRVQTSAACTVNITSNAAVNPAEHPITLTPGWTWIGYPTTETMTVAQALANITPTDNDVIKSKTKTAIFRNGAWMNGFPITPGMGLMYKSNSSTNVTLVYATGAKGDAVEEEALNYHWTPNASVYPSNMSVLALVELDGTELQGEQYELAVFANGECRGIAPLMQVDNRWLALLTIAGDEMVELRFGLYNSMTGDECFNADEVLYYTADALVGDFDDPFVIRFREITGVIELSHHMQVYPNPVAKGETFSVALPMETLGKVQVEIINVLGIVIEMQCFASSQTLTTITAPTIPGIYMLRITAEGRELFCRKLVVK